MRVWLVTEPDVNVSTGFANSIASCAIEFKNEGLVFGLGSKMFFVAGPVLVNGVAYSIIVGIVYMLIYLL